MTDNNPAHPSAPKWNDLQTWQRALIVIGSVIVLAVFASWVIGGIIEREAAEQRWADQFIQELLRDSER